MTKEKINLLALIPYIGSILIFLEVCRLLIFYSFFNIDIINFVGIDELLVYFFDLLPYGVGLFLWNLFLQFYLYDSNPNDPANSDTKIQKRINCSVHIIDWVILVCGIVVFWQTYLQYKFLGIAILALVPYVGTLILKKFLQVNSKYVSKLNGGLIISLFFFLAIMINFTINHALDIKYKGKSLGVELQMENNQTFVSDSSVFYIGKTKDFVFIFNNETKKSSAVKIELIQEFTFPNK